MKNLKKVLALVVALTMVLGTVSFAFTDVDSENEVYTAVQTLSALSILNGYEDGTFGPEKDITRAEFAAVVCRALDMESSANGAKGATPFTDVPADHWASGYINLAAGQGIVNGYGDGRFGPEDNVTYEQAVKMLVVALGFEPMAAQKGGFPTGYLVVANQYGMTKNVNVSGDSAAANRGVVAQLTFNALDIPMMEQTGFGTNIEYKVQDGKNGNGYNTLLVGLDVAKRDGVVVGTPVINNNNYEADEVRYDVKALYGVTPTNPSPVAIAAGEHTFKVAEGIEVDSYFQAASTIYLKEVKTGRWDVIAIMPGEVSETIELTKGDLAAAVTSTELKYYESETATKETTEKLDNIAGGAANDFIYNNSAVAFNDILNNGSYSDDAKITLINNDEDSAFDVIIIKEYDYERVQEVEADRDRFTTSLNTFRFFFDDDTKRISISDKDGNAMDLADFAEGDVIAYISSGSTTSYTWIEVINLGQNAVTGTITETNSNDNTVSVDGVVYELAAGCPAIAVSDEGTFFLTAEGKIFDVDATGSISSNYAYILEAGFGSTGAFGNGWQLRLLTKEGNIQIFDMKDTFEVDSVKYAAVANSPVVAYNVSSPVSFATIAGYGADHVKDFENRIITYKLDNNNAIQKVTFVSDKVAAGSLNSDGTINTTEEYKAGAQKLAGKVIDDDAVVFNITASDMDATKVMGVGSLVDETDYVGVLARVDANKDYNCVVIAKGAANIDYTQDIAIVESTSTGVDADGEDVTKVTYYTSNDETAKVITFNDETNAIGSANLGTDLVKGTIFMFAEDGNGLATDIAVLAKIGVGSDAGKYVTVAAGAADAIGNEDENEFITGYIYDWANRNGRVITYHDGMVYDVAHISGYAHNDDIVVTTAANAYTVVNNSNATRSYIAVADYQADEDIDRAVDGNGNPIDAKANFFFARCVDGVVTDIVVLGDRVAY